MNGSGQLAGLPPFANLVIRKLQRFDECAGDGQGADIGAQWFDVLTQLGLLKRVQRSPALWQITEQGERLLEFRSGAKSEDAYRLESPFCDDGAACWDSGDACPLCDGLLSIRAQPASLASLVPRTCQSNAQGCGR